MLDYHLPFTIRGVEYHSTLEYITVTLGCTPLDLQGTLDSPWILPFVIEGYDAMFSSHPDVKDFFMNQQVTYKHVPSTSIFGNDRDALEKYNIIGEALNILFARYTTPVIPLALATQLHMIDRFLEGDYSCTTPTPEIRARIGLEQEDRMMALRSSRKRKMICHTLLSEYDLYNLFMSMEACAEMMKAENKEECFRTFYPQIWNSPTFALYHEKWMKRCAPHLPYRRTRVMDLSFAFLRLSDIQQWTPTYPYKELRFDTHPWYYTNIHHPYPFQTYPSVFAFVEEKIQQQLNRVPALIQESILAKCHNAHFINHVSVQLKLGDTSLLWLSDLVAKKETPLRLRIQSPWTRKKFLLYYTMLKKRWKESKKSMMDFLEDLFGKIPSERNVELYVPIKDREELLLQAFAVERFNSYILEYNVHPDAYQALFLQRYNADLKCNHGCS